MTPRSQLSPPAGARHTAHVTSSPRQEPDPAGTGIPRWIPPHWRELAENTTWEHDERCFRMKFNAEGGKKKE